MVQLLKNKNIQPAETGRREKSEGQVMSYQARSGRMGQLVSIGLLNMPLIVITLLLGLIGVMVLYSVAGGDFSPWAWRHAAVAVGLVLMYAIANLDLRTIFNFAYPIYGAYSSACRGADFRR